MKSVNNNKGFSLVELIVVIAIMAVLIGVLSPQYLRYVEKSRLQKDNSAIAEIANTIKIAMADEAINAAVADGTTVTLTNAASSNASVTFADDDLQAELAISLGASVETTSTNYNNSATDIVLTINKDEGVVTVTGTGIIPSVGDDPVDADNAIVY